MPTPFQDALYRVRLIHPKMDVHQQTIWAQAMDRYHRLGSDPHTLFDQGQPLVVDNRVVRTERHAQWLHEMVK